MAPLAIGSVGPAVRALQEMLNRLPGSALPPLAADARYGTKTAGRIREFQAANRLTADGVVGPLTLAALEALLKLILPPGPTPAPTAVRPVNQEILGMAGTDNLIPQILPGIPLIAESTYRRGDQLNRFQFTGTAVGSSRLGIFAASKNGVERAVILMLPPQGAPDRVLLCVSQGFGQAAGKLEPLGWKNPLSKPFVQFALLKHVINRWGTQTMVSRRSLAFVYILRAKPSGKNGELGPFAADGPFVRQVLTELSELTNRAFTAVDGVEAFTFSSGITDFNPFVAALGGALPVRAVYSIDPARAQPAAAPPRAVRRQFLSGQTGGGAAAAGFEFLPMDRWANEPRFPFRNTFPQPAAFHYMHNHCMPQYILHLALQTS